MLTKGECCSIRAEVVNLEGESRHKTLECHESEACVTVPLDSSPQTGVHVK